MWWRLMCGRRARRGCVHRCPGTKRGLWRAIPVLNDLSRRCEHLDLRLNSMDLIQVIAARCKELDETRVLPFFRNLMQLHSRRSMDLRVPYRPRSTLTPPNQNGIINVLEWRKCGNSMTQTCAYTIVKVNPVTGNKQDGEYNVGQRGTGLSTPPSICKCPTQSETLVAKTLDE